MTVDERFGAIDEDAGGVAVTIADDFATWRVGRIVGDAGDFHGLFVGEARVPIDARQPDGVVRHSAREIFVIGHRLAGP